MELLQALWCDPQAFATGGEVNRHVYPMPPSLHVDGAGSISLPLTADGLTKLKNVSQQAPYGLGELTLVDTDVRRAWQVNPDKVSCPESPEFFTKVVNELAAAALAHMGMDATSLQLNVNLYKLLLYEAGGHFKFHRDTEKEEGMFATLIIQLPTESGHTGGALAVRHKRRCCSFDFSYGSSSQYFSTVFFCDCEHQLEEVVSGSRLCLVFSLVRNNPSFVPADNVPSFVSALPRTEALLRQWATSELKVGGKRKLLAIPLAHKYSKKSLSFAGLKGHDRVVAALVRSCDFLELHLCMLTKYKKVDESERKVSYGIDNWMSTEDQPAKFKQWSIDIEEEVLRSKRKEEGNDEDDEDEDSYDREDNDLFDFLEDEFHGTGRLAGNEGGTDEFFYHVAVLVVWPKDKRMQAICPGLLEIPSALDWLFEEFGDDFTTPGVARQHLQEMARDLTTKFDSLTSVTFNGYGRPIMQVLESAKRLLELCVKSGLQEETFLILSKWGLDLMTTKEMAAAVNNLGWDECREMIQRLVERANVLQVGGFPLELSSCGCQNGAVSAAKMLCEKVVRGELQFGYEFDQADGIDKLVEFCLQSGLKEEITAILSKVPSNKVGAGKMAMFMHYYPENIETVESYWEEKKKLLEAKGKKLDIIYGVPATHPTTCTREYLKDVVDFALGLELLGQHESAVAFAIKLVSDAGLQLEEFKTYERDNNLMILLLLHGQVKLVDENTRQPMLHMNYYYQYTGKLQALKKAAGLLSLKQNEEMKKLFTKFCRAELQVVVDAADGTAGEARWSAPSTQDYDTGENKKTWEQQREFLSMLFWLEDEELLREMVQLVSTRINLTQKMLDKDDGLVEEAMQCGECVKAAMKKVVEARIDYLSAEPGLSDHVELIEKYMPASKKLKLCGILNATEVVGNPRRSRFVHELLVDNWKACSDEMERLRMLQEML